MRIGIDVRALGTASGRRGIGSYIRGLVGGLAGQIEAGGDELILFCGDAAQAEGLARQARRIVLSRPSRAITLWDQFAWGPLLARLGVDLFHSPFYAVPRMRPRRCRVVQTIHDLTPLRLPGAVSRRNRRLFAINFRFARHAHRILVPSAATRDEVVRILAIPADRIRVIPEASGIGRDELEAARTRLPGLLARLGVRPRYLLHSGGHDLVKNLPGLIAAFAQLASSHPDLDLVIAGEHSDQTPSLIAAAARLGLLSRVSLPGYVPREDLLALYGGAAVMVYPSWTEGFGLPVLEAMACGAPVVISDRGALPEVAADAALAADPSSHAAIASAVARLLDDPDLAAEMTRRGARRAAGFSWDLTARLTMQAYREAA